MPFKFADIVSAGQSGQLIGRKVAWKGENKDIPGKIIGFNGRTVVVK
jgi:ribosomal protein L35AE/L33A